jgi:RNA polymerase sigma-70 factor, ECF subfamily
MPSSHEKAFLEAFDQYADALFRHAYFRLSNREQAVDLTQEAFLKAWEYIREKDEIKHWKGFLYHILNNLIVDYYRRKKPESLDEMMEDDPIHADALLVQGSRQEKEERLDEEFMIAKLRALTLELPEQYRVVLSLRYFDGFSLKEISSFLHLSENVVSVRIHRATARLKALSGFTDTL